MASEGEVQKHEDPEVLPGDRPVRYVNIAGRRVRVPVSRILRMALGGVLVVGGIMGFLPVLGFWMVPVGLVILSVDLPPIRRLRRRMEVRFGRWYRARRGSRKAG